MQHITGEGNFPPPVLLPSMLKKQVLRALSSCDELQLSNLEVVYLSLSGHRPKKNKSIGILDLGI